MQTRSNLTAVARANCSACQGLGAQLVDGTPCPCALREIFRQCHSRFRDCNNKPKHLSAAILMRSRGASASVAFVRAASGPGCVTFPLLTFFRGPDNIRTKKNPAVSHRAQRGFLRFISK